MSHHQAEEFLTVPLTVPVSPSLSSYPVSKAHRWRQFKLSNDPQFATKVRDVVGLYMNPHARRRHRCPRQTHDARPGLWEQMHGSRLRFIYRRGAPSLLVAENMRARTGKRGGFAKGSASALRSGRGITTVVMFILVPQVSLRKRLDVNAAAERWASALPELIVRNWR